MKEINNQSLVARNDDMITGIVDHDIMMMSIETGMYYQLNPTAHQIWMLLEEPRTIDSLCKLLSGQFKVVAEVCQKDLINFIIELEARKIVFIR
ncbi:MAG: PqqD family protein [Desulfamplus sp.]|nr:PqqD family protein [Desulfamplus sp.]